MTREVVTDEARLAELLPTWYGLDFALDLETSGLDYIKERILGVALCFADGRSYYVVCEHTIPEERVVAKTRIEREIIGEEGYDHVTPSGKTKRKTRPVFAERETAYEETETFYPTRAFVPRARLALLLRPLLVQPDVVMVAHNLKFELHHLARLGLEMRGKLADTLLAAQLINENWESKGLKELAHLVGFDLKPYSSLVSYPGFGKHEILGVPLEAAAEYAMLDAEACWALWERFKFDLTEEGVDWCFREVWMPLLPVLQQMEAKGIALDLEQVRQVREEQLALIDTHERTIWAEGTEMLLSRLEMLPLVNAVIGQSCLEKWGWAPTLRWWHVLKDSQVTAARGVSPSEVAPETEHVEVNGVVLPVLRKENKAFQPRVPWFKPTSNDHLSELLYDWHGIEVPTDFHLKLNKSGEVGVDRDTLVVLRASLGENAPAVLDHILGLRKASKFVSTYLDNFLKLADPSDHDCIRTSFNQAVTDTGRLSSSSPINLSS